MMNKWLYVMLTAIFGAFFLFESCSPFNKVYSEEEPGVNLASYHTYKWSENDAKHGNKGPEWLSENMQTKIRSALDAKMRACGYTSVPDKADLELHYHVVIKNEVLYIHDWSCISKGGNPYGQCKPVKPVQYQEGTLILDFTDAQNGVQVWRGAAVSVLENLSPEQVDERIESAAKAIFKKFPVKPKA